MSEQNERLLTPEEIGDNLDLEVEAQYPCSDGSFITTVSVDKLLQAQEVKTRKMTLEEVGEWLEKHTNEFGSSLGQVDCFTDPNWFKFLKALKQGKRLEEVSR